MLAIRRKRLRATPRPGRHVMMVMQWYSHIYHRGIARYASEAGWSLDANAAHLKDIPALDRVDGIIANIFERTPAARALLESSVPIVNLAHPKLNMALPVVLMDNHGVGAAVAEYYFARGFRHFAFGAYRLEDWTAVDRLRGFRRGLRRRGLDCELVAACRQGTHTLSVAAMLDALGRQLRAMPGPVAFLAHNDDFAVSVLRACARARLRVPEDVAIIGCDNDQLICEFARVPLSSADPRLEQQAYEAAALLDRLMHGEKPPRKPICVPHGGIVERQSSNVLAVSHPKLAAAIRTIWSEYANPVLSVERLAQEAGLSRRGLDMACQTHIGRTISQELRRVRLERALHLLEAGQEKIADVARLCGFSRADHLRKTMLRRYGLTSRDYRRNASGALDSAAKTPLRSVRPSTAR